MKRHSLSFFILFLAVLSVYVQARPVEFPPPTGKLPTPELPTLVPQREIPPPTPQRQPLDINSLTAQPIPQSLGGSPRHLLPLHIPKPGSEVTATVSQAREPKLNKDKELPPLPPHSPNSPMVFADPFFDVPLTPLERVRVKFWSDTHPQKQRNWPPNEKDFREADNMCTSSNKGLCNVM